MKNPDLKKTLGMREKLLNGILVIKILGINTNYPHKRMCWKDIVRNNTMILHITSASSFSFDNGR